METISRYLVTFLLNSLWQIPLIAAVAVLACRLMRRASAAHRHVIWVAALVVSLLLPIASVRSERQIGSWNIPEPDTTALVTVANRTTSPGQAVSPPSPATNTRTVPIGRTLAGLLAGVYLLFFFYRTIRFALAWSRTIRIRRSVLPSPASAPMDRVWTRCLREFGLRDVQLLFSEQVSSPLMTGLWRRTIVLPASLASETSEDVLATAIGHEMAHIARHDFVCNVVYELLYLPVSFHPAAWILRRSIEQTREIACDELVTHRLLDPHVYARSIVSIATSLVGTCGPDYALGVFDGDILEERIRRLVEQPVAKLRNAGLALASGLSALIFCAVLASGLAIRARAQSNQTIIVKPSGPKFEVASIRPSAPPGPNMHIGITSNPGRVNIGYWSVLQYIVKAYRLDSYQLNGPDWIGSTRFDIQATLPQGSSQEQIPEMLKWLLAERFSLVVHAETKELSGFALTVEKGGPKIKVTPPEPGDSLDLAAEDANSLDLLWGGGKPFGLVSFDRRPTGDLHMDFRKLPIAALAQILSSNLRAPVNDLTGLKGKYHVTLDYNPVPEVASTAESVGDLFVAVKRLGLKLERQSVRCNVLVVDQVLRVPIAD